VSDEHRFEEEEFSSQFNGGTVRRLLKQLLPYKGQVALFLACAVGVSFMESYFTLLSKQIVDDGIVAGNADLIGRLALQ
jgi:ABC-type multidrug transport system fused ATPase/permease subunit